jgi:hypothetical protein
LVKLETARSAIRARSGPAKSVRVVRRPATKILGVALALAVAVVFSSALWAELRRDREERACASGEIAACEARCRRGSSRACDELARRCSAREAGACDAAVRAKGARERRVRW